MVIKSSWPVSPILPVIRYRNQHLPNQLTSTIPMALLSLRCSLVQSLCSDGLRLRAWPTLLLISSIVGGIEGSEGLRKVRRFSLTRLLKTNKFYSLLHDSLIYFFPDQNLPEAYTQGWAPKQHIYKFLSSRRSWPLFFQPFFFSSPHFGFMVIQIFHMSGWPEAKRWGN